MKFLQWLAVTTFASLGAAEPSKYFANRPIFTPPANTSVMYPRATELEDGTILATIGWRASPVKKPYFPVFESKDGGWTWKHISNITDKVNCLGMTAQPALSVLPYDIGEFSKGTVLASGNSWGDSSTNIDLYASSDNGHSWKFVSKVASGGRPNTTNSADPIWEPFILPYEGKLGMFYSDQRDWPAHGQKLAHQESTDLKEWGPVVNDVAYLNSTLRPGMTVIDYIPTIDKWIFIYEFPPSAGGINYFTNEYPVYYKLASSPFDFRYADGFPIIANESSPNASPYVVWSASGGANGTLIVSDADVQELFTNQHVGRVDRWVKREQPGLPAYSRGLHVMKTDPDRLMVFSGSTFDSDPADGVVPFSVTVISVEKLVAGGYTNESI